MLDNSSSDLSTAAAATVKRYAPPNQRNRSLGRRKSGGDRLERANSYVSSDGDSNSLASTKSGNHGDYRPNAKLIPLHGCSNSEAFQLLNNRWTATMNAYNTLPEDSAERPVIYTKKSSSAWGQPMLPHLLIQPSGGATSGLNRDFMGELRQAMHNANSGL